MLAAACSTACRPGALPTMTAFHSTPAGASLPMSTPTGQSLRALCSRKRSPAPSAPWVSRAMAAPQSPPAGASSSAAPSSRLADVDLLPVLSVQGFINPDMPEGTEATMFAIYDQSKTLQYIGFSKNLRASLLTVFSRRPDKCHLFRAFHMPVLNQAAMLELRSAWFEQAGGPPPGNKLPAERAAWQEAATPFSISDRGKAAAAEELMKQMLVKIKSRGCKEEFLVNHDLLAQGKVDFLAAAELSAEELERQRKEAAAAVNATRKCSVMIDGEDTPFDVFFKSTIKTNGGYMFDLRWTAGDRETTHRVIVGRDYYRKDGIEPEDVIERVFAYLLAKGVQRQTDGLLTISEFPINYFSISEVHQFFDDFDSFFGDDWLKDAEAFWRFNRTEDYGYKGKNEDVQALAKQFRIEDDDDE